MQTLQQEFGLHELVIEDALVAHQRPKPEQYGESLFIVVKSAYLNEQQRLHFGEPHFFLGKNFLITVRHGSSERVTAVRAKAEKNPAMLCYAFYCIVDNYSKITESLSERISELEEGIFTIHFDSQTLKQVYHLRHELLALRDVQDHSHHVTIDTEDMREMLTSAMQINLALVSVQQSEVNKKLAGWG